MQTLFAAMFGIFGVWSLGSAILVRTAPTVYRAAYGLLGVAFLGYAGYLAIFVDSDSEFGSAYNTIVVPVMLLAAYLLRKAHAGKSREPADGGES